MSALKRQLLLITVILAAIMELIDTSIVNVALNYMSGNLGSTLEDTAWVITAYAIANVIIIPMTSFLTAQLGRRNYYIGSIILFTVSSWLCGQAGSIWTLVAFRFFQGLGGGALLSVSQAVVFELFPKEKQGIASALFGVGVFIGPTIGPTLGGFITENYNWPWIFYINIPIGITAAVSCYYLLTEPKSNPTVRRIDWPGILLLAVSIGTLQTVLERGETDDWFSAPYICWFTAISLVGGVVFIIHELRTKEPVVNLRVFKSKTLSIAALLTFVSGIGMFTSIFLTPVIAQRLLGFTPTQTGLLLLPGAILAVIGLLVSGKLLQNGIPPLAIIIAGFACFIYFNWRMSQINLDTSHAEITFTLIFRALGMAFLTVPLITLAVSTLKPELIPQGAALNNMMRQLGGSFGISIINTYSYRSSVKHRNELLVHLRADNPLFVQRLKAYTDYFLGRGVVEYDAHRKAIAAIGSAINRQSVLLSYLDAYRLIGLLFLLAMPLLLFVTRRPKGPVIAVSEH